MTRVAQAWALRTVKRAAAVVDDLYPPTPGVVILAYHRVGGSSGLEIDLPAALFEEQMAALGASGRVDTLDAALAKLMSPGATGDCSVVVTFDDGTADFVATALPVLARYRIPATLYLATRFVEDGTPFPHAGAPLSWAALRDAVSTGLVSIGSHTHSHVLLDRLPPNEVADELDRSIDLIGERLGVAGRDFAYPKALLGSALAETAVRRRFRSAALSGTRANPFGRTDPFHLARSPVQISDGMRYFLRKAMGGMAMEGALRQMLSHRRYADAQI